MNLYLPVLYSHSVIGRILECIWANTFTLAIDAMCRNIEIFYPPNSKWALLL